MIGGNVPLLRKSLLWFAEKGYVYLKAPIKRVTRAQVPVPHSPVLEREMLISEEKLIKAVKEILQ